MSEKDARCCLKLLRDEMPDSIDKVLADPPDVVEMLWYLEKKAEDYQKQEKMLGTGIGVSEVRRQEIDLLVGFIERKFHIRLIETGWEWTDG